jgi:hypothetical protein
LNSSARKKRKREESSTQGPHHGVERIGDADDEGFRGVLLDAGADLLHHLQIDAQQIVTAHAGLARHAGSDDADLGAVNRLIGIGAGVVGVKTVDRRGLGDVEGLALGHALGDVEHHDVAQLLQPNEMGERAADLTGANQSNLVACHGKRVLVKPCGRKTGSSVVSRFGSSVQVDARRGDQLPSSHKALCFKQNRGQWCAHENGRNID